MTLKQAATSLHTRFEPRVDLKSQVLRVTSNPHTPDPTRSAYLADASQVLPQGFAAYLRRSDDAFDEITGEAVCVPLPESLSYLTEGDIVRINPQHGELWVMYRKNSPSNALLLTERCNSYCIMCSQPPRNEDDSWLVGAWLEAISLMDASTNALGITGGEPTLLGDDFLRIVSACKHHLPRTSLHVLSNGRNFAYLSLAHALSNINHPDVMIGIPLYSDIAWRHEFVVQSPASFDHTVRGILNLARCRVPVEIRIVLHRHTIDRLPQLATFIARNFPFVAHVAIMGLEPIGFAKTNFNALWVDPLDYQPQLEAAVATLHEYGLHVSIYNHQLCVLAERLWPYAVQSISDWKNIYLPVCGDCSVNDRCGGLFHSATSRHSRGIAPVFHVSS